MENEGFPSDRSAAWIGAPSAGKSRISVYAEEGAAFACTEFTREYVPGFGVRRAEIHISADVLYRLYCNGELVGTGPCALGGDYGQTDALPYRYYDSYSIALQGSSLQIQVLVINRPLTGMQFSAGVSGLWLHGTLFGDNGEHTEIKTDGTWLQRQDTRFVNPGCYDASRPLPAFRPAALPEYPAALQKAPVPAMTVEYISPEIGDTALTLYALPGEEKELRLTFGQVYAGQLLFSYSGGESFDLTIQYAEILRDSGRESCRLSGAGKYLSMGMISMDHCILTLKNNGSQPVSVYGFQWRFEHDPAEQKGSFCCSEEGLNRVYAVCAHTLRLCRQSIHLDSPLHQEPLGCTGDYLIEALMDAAVIGNFRLTAADILRTAQLLRLHGGKMFHTNYSLIWVQMVWDYYMFTADLALLGEVSDALDTLLDRFSGYMAESGLPEKAPDYMFVDWVERNGYTLHHPPKALGLSVLSAFLYRALVLGGKIQNELRHREQAEAYALRGAGLKDAFRIHLYDEDKKLFKEGLPTPDLGQPGGWLPKNPPRDYYGVYANALAVLYDLCDRDEAAPLLQRLPEGDGSEALAGMESIQPYFMHFVLEAVQHAGLFEEKGLRLLRRWIPVVDACPKGLAEGWIKPQADYLFDHSHAWGGTPAYQLPVRLLGLELLQPGYRKIRLAPRLYGLDSAAVVWPTPLGPISCRMKAGQPVELSVPEGITVVSDSPENAGGTVKG